MGKPENSVQSAIEQVCQIYSVPCFREQSRVLKVGNRLVFYGTWKDARGILHSCGKADYLLIPKIHLPQLSNCPRCGGGGSIVDEEGANKAAWNFNQPFDIRDWGMDCPDCEDAEELSPYVSSVPLWCEAKSGKERAAKPNRCMCGDAALDHQEHFRKYVTGAGAYHLVVRDSAETLVQWLKEHGVIKSGK